MNITHNDIGLKTLSDELSVSMTTISRAVKDCSDISYDKKCLIIQKLLDLNYIPLDVRKSIKNRKKQLIGVVVDSMVSPFFGMAVENLIIELKKKNYDVVVFPTRFHVLDNKCVDDLIKENVDGFISFILLDKLAYLRSRLFKLPGLIYGRYQDYDGIHCIYMDDFMGGELAAEFLAKKTKTNKFVYAANDKIECNKRRFEGYKTKLQELGKDNLAYLKDEDIDEKLEALINDGYDSFFTFDDSLASVILNKAKSKIHIVGFNGISKFYHNIFNFPSIDADYLKMVEDSTNIIVNNINTFDSETIKRKYEVRLG